MPYQPQPLAEALKWRRGVEDNYPGTNDSSLRWDAEKGKGWDLANKGELLSGMVVTIEDGTGDVIAKANGGAHRGIIINHVDSSLDESRGGNRPAVIVGEVLVTLFEPALDPNVTYEEGVYATTANGFVVPVDPDADPAPTANTEGVIGFIQEFKGNSIKLRMFGPTV